MKILITGVNGFVGRHLVQYLSQFEHIVSGTVLSEPSDFHFRNVDIMVMDVTNSKQVENVIQEYRPNQIIHLAAQSSVATSWKLPQITMDVNVIGTLNLLEACRKLEVNPRILLIGSSEEYGIVQPQDNPVNEGHEIEPANPYSISKIAQNMIGQLYVNSFNMDVVIARSFNHIGPGQSPDFVASDFARKIAEIEKGLIKPVLMVGNLEAERDFTDVRDVVRAYYYLLNKGVKGEIYNVGSGKSVKIKLLLEKLLELTHSKIKIEQDPDRLRPSDVPIIRCDNAKLKKTTGWKPTFTLEDTLSDLLDYWRTKNELYTNR